MKLTILGSSGAFPGPGLATSGYLLEIDGHHLLIDCGSGVLSRMLEYIRLDQLEAIILTHLHSDHISDIGVLKYAMDLSRKAGQTIGNIPVYAPKTPEPLAASLESPGNFTLIPIADDHHFDLFGAQIHCFGTIHPFETCALRIEKDGRVFATTSDTIPCANLTPLLRQADLALLDAGSQEKLRTPVMVHMTAAECGTIAAQNDVKNMLLIHLLPFFNRAESILEARTAAGDSPTTIDLAEPGLTYTI
ncbi:MAG: MBL fold metallo-hydrolase [Eubacteriales bacterium]|nr:MBL fold metallo-hydrolase [Eubacteriales bacterium]